MTESLKLQYNKSELLDRCDIFQNSCQVYPESYREFQRSIERIFFKSELLLKCKLEFERLITIDLPMRSDSLYKDTNLSLIFTGAMKSGRSSLINMLLNAKVLPTSLIGSSCSVSISHPKSDAKVISVGVHDLDGWEVDKFSGVDISELPMKIANLQNELSRNSRDKNDKYNKRIHVQLPHWLLKNIRVFECSAIDGIYSFEEPFNIIVNAEYPILIYVIDASNGLMQWDRTFLAKVQNKWPNLPIFFVINHVDIRLDILSRDRGPRFLSISERFKSEFFENESSECYSSDDNNNDNCFLDGVLNDSLIIKEQAKLIEKNKNQITKLGFMLENGLITRYAPLSVKEFITILSSVDNKKNCYWKLANEFFSTFNGFLKIWFEHLLITWSLVLQSQINGVVDAVRCKISYPNDGIYEVGNDTLLKDIKIAEIRIKSEIIDIQNELEKEVTNSAKERLKQYESSISRSLPDFETTDYYEIVRLIKPKLLESFGSILLGGKDDYNINEEINRILETLYKRIESVFINIYKSNKMLTFFECELTVFRILKRTLTCPVMLRLPDDIIQTEEKWYKELFRNASRKIRRTIVGHENIVTILIDDIKVASILRITQIVLGNILKQIKNFTKTYKQTYRLVLTGSNISPDIFKRLLLVDFVLKVIEKSYRRKVVNLRMEDLNKLPTFFTEFFDQGDHMIKCINIQSFTALQDVVNSMCYDRMCQPSPFVMSHDHTQLLDNGICLMYYRKMDYDLLTAIQNNTIWHVKDILGIMKQLLNAVKALQHYQKYLHIDLLPENIILRKDSRNLHECILYPFSAEISSIGYQYRSKRKFKCNFDGVIFQFGMVLSWLLTNDIFICTMITCDNLCPMNEFVDHISERVPICLKNTNLIDLATNLLFKPEAYSNIDTISKEFENINCD